MGNNKKYETKLEESFITKIQLFLFNKLLNDKTLEENQLLESINEEIKDFNIKNDLANLYSNTYYQLELKKENKIKLEGKETFIDDICNKMYSKTKIKKLLKNKLKKSFENYKDAFEKIFPREDFTKLLEDDKCSYCGISLKQIELLGNNKKLNNKRSDTRGYSLEIDRKLPNLEYSKENCCMACYWCNNAKTDEFSPKEFKPIAEGINKAWNKRLSEITKENIEKFNKENNTKVDKEVKFNDKDKIWEIDFKKK